MDTRGKILEAKLTVIFNELEEVKKITEEKVSTEFMLNIVGSYILSKQADKLAEGYMTPAEIFQERFIPIIDGDITNENICDEDIAEEEIEDENISNGDIYDEE